MNGWPSHRPAVVKQDGGRPEMALTPVAVRTPRRTADSLGLAAELPEMPKDAFRCSLFRYISNLSAACVDVSGMQVLFES